MPLLDGSRMVHIDLPHEGEWVKVKERLSRGDMLRVQKAVLRNARMGAIDASGNADIEVDPAEAIDAAEFATLEVAIIAWSFKAPVTPGTIRQLDPESVEHLKRELNVLYPDQLADSEKKDSGADGSEPSSTVEPLRLSSAG